MHEERKEEMLERLVREREVAAGPERLQDQVDARDARSRIKPEGGGPPWS